MYIGYIVTCGTFYSNYIYYVTIHIPMVTSIIHTIVKLQNTILLINVPPVIKPIRCIFFSGIGNSVSPSCRYSNKSDRSLISVRRAG